MPNPNEFVQEDTNGGSGTSGSSSSGSSLNTTAKYVQLHPTHPEDNSIDESINVYPIIGPGSFEGFEEEGETFEPQKKLVSGSNIKTITIGSDVVNLVPTENAGTLNLNTALLNLLYPKGSVYYATADAVFQYDSSGKPICPIQTNLGGTWTRIEGRFLYAAAVGDESTLGNVGGSNDAVLVEHTHTIDSGTGGHSHPVNVANNTSLKSDLHIRGQWDDWGHHIDTILQSTANTDLKVTFVQSDEDSGVRINNYSEVDPSSGTYYADKIAIDATHNHLASIPDYTGNHTHTLSDEGEDGTGKNMPSYLVVLAWKREE